MGLYSLLKTYRPQRLKELTENKDVIAALEALRHPRAGFSANCLARALRARR
jgi:hypothetical protein